jgi:uncharacterized protein YraI
MEKHMSRKHLIVFSFVVSLLLGMMVPAMAQTPTPTPPTTPALTASTAFYATANFRANVRSGPGVKYTVIGQLKPADAVDITGRLKSNSWVRVNFNGQEGWVSFGLVKITGDVNDAPEAEAGSSAVLRVTANQTITTELKTVVVITRVNANLRASASSDATSLAVIPFSTTLTVTGRTAGNNWVRVTYNNQTGWISSGTLIFSQGNIANAPLLDENGNPATATPEPTKAP